MKILGIRKTIMKMQLLRYLIIVLSCICNTKASAHDIEVKNADGVTIYYCWISNKTELSVTYCGDYNNNEYSGNIVIPESVNYGGKAYNVTFIGFAAFNGCSSLTSVTIPSGVTRIDDASFAGCRALTSVVIPNRVTSIGEKAFAESGLASVTIGSSVALIEDDAFKDCNNLKSVHIADLAAWCNVKFYKEDAGRFSNPLSIAHHLYMNGIEVKNLIIPQSVTSIGDYAFYRCSGLTSITIPNSVTSIGYNAFEGTAWYDNQSDGLVYAGKVAYKYKGTMPVNTHISIMDGTLGIAGYAFYRCSGLTSITIPNSVTSIGGSAFYGTAWYDNQPEGLVYAGEVAYGYKGKMPDNTHITIKDGTLGLSGLAFSGRSGLTSITIPNSVTSIGVSAFQNCSSLKSVIIPYGVTSIADGTFSWCNSLTSVTIPDNVAYIGHLAFGGCSSLKSVSIPNRVTFIGHMAFGGCNGLIKIVSEIEKPFNILSSAFSYTAELIVPKGTKALYQATEGWNKFAMITEAEGEEEVSEFSVNGIYYKVGIGIGDIVDDNNNVFVTSGDVKYSGDVVIPEQVTYNSKTYRVVAIGDDAFSSCKGLTSVTIPSSIGYIGADAFMNCHSLTSVHISDLSRWCKMSFYPYVSDSNPLYFARHLFLNDKEIKDLVIPNGVTYIGNRVFLGCSEIASVTIPNSVTSIGYSAFDGTAWYNNQPEGLVYAGKFAYKYKGEMPANTHITIMDGTLGIAEKAFSFCSGLTSVTIPNSVTSIGWGAFERCTGLSSVTIPNSVTSIDYYAFAYCSGLTTIVSEIEKPFVINSYIFSDDTYTNAELIVPKGTKALYQATEGWNKFAKITEAGDKDEVAFAIDGISYQGSKPEKNVVVKSVDTSKTWLEIPASVSYDGVTYQVTGIDNDVFKGSSMAALIWDVEAVLPNNAFSNASIGSNFLLYVKSSSYAPSSVKNVVVDGTAQTIVLSDDGGQFYCPQTFTARSISYIHNYSMDTDIGKAKGWETLALPFDVQKIVHSTRGEIVPFPSYNSSSAQKPFWLANFSGNGFRRTAAVLANEPYIIAMPNSSSYRNEYNLAGDVTFSADNVQVPKTLSFSGTFVPAFATVAKSSSVYALNVNNRNVKYSGSYDAGSRFISSLRDVRPFEAYMTGGSSTRGVIEINFDDGTTDIVVILFTADDCQEMTIHTLSGQQVTRTTQRDFGQVWDNLPKGVYIVNGKKKIK